MGKLSKANQRINARYLYIVGAVAVVCFGAAMVVDTGSHWLMVVGGIATLLFFAIPITKATLTTLEAITTPRTVKYKSPKTVNEKHKPSGNMWSVIKRWPYSSPEDRLRLYSSTFVKAAVFPVIFIAIMGISTAKTFIFSPIHNGIVEQVKCTDSIDVDMGRYGGVKSRCAEEERYYIPLEKVIASHASGAVFWAVAGGVIWIFVSRAGANSAERQIMYRDSK